MRRSWKIALGVALGLLVLLVVNAVVVDGETKRAEVTVPGGRILDLPGGEVQVVDHGPRRGDPIVLIHCFTCAIDWWDRMMPALESEHRVVAVDLLGHGGSEKPGSGYEIPNQADLIAQALRRLGVRKAEVVGHSLGGTVAVALAERHPEAVDRVVIVDTATDRGRSSLGLIAGLAFQPVIGEFFWTVKPDFAIRDGMEVAFAPGFEIPDAFIEDVNRMTFSAYDDSPSASGDFVDEATLGERMRSTGLPLMVIMGAEEQIVDGPAGALAEYEQEVPGVRTVLIEDAGHSPNVETPARTAALVLGFGAKREISAERAASAPRK